MFKIELTESNLEKNIFDKKNKNENFSEKQIYSIINQILDALIYLKSYNIFHFDIKPSNIKVIDNRYILGNFESF